MSLFFFAFCFFVFFYFLVSQPILYCKDECYKGGLVCREWGVTFFQGTPQGPLEMTYSQGISLSQGSSGSELYWKLGF